MALRKVQANFDEALIAKVDAFAESMHINRTAAMSVLMTQALDSRDGLDAIKRLMDAYEIEKLKNSGLSD